LTESQFQGQLIKKLRALFPHCTILKNDSEYIQGIPDLLILFQDKWAALEVKAAKKSAHQPNQDYYISELNAMSFAAFIYPENEEEVLYALQQTFGTHGTTRFSQS
jgi:hypothetical protein